MGGPGPRRTKAVAAGAFLVMLAAGSPFAAAQPQAWQGEWRGSVQQAEHRYSVEMLVRLADSGGLTGFTHYPELGCSGRLTLEATLPGHAVSFRETIIEGRRCASGGSISLGRTGDERRWYWHDTVGNLRVVATIARGAPSAHIAQLARRHAPPEAAPRPSGSQEAASRLGAGIHSLDGFYAVSIASELALMRFVVRGGDEASGFAYELHGVASTDPSDRHAIGRAAYRGRWWPDTQQFEEQVGFPSPSCTFWRHRGWTTQLAPVNIEVGGRNIGVWQHTDQSPPHRAPDSRRWCRVVEFDLACRRAVACHRWETAADRAGAFFLVDNAADARALYAQAQARRSIGIGPAVPATAATSGAMAGVTPPSVAVANSSPAAAADGAKPRPAQGPYGDPAFVATCQAYALLEPLLLRESASESDMRAKALREHWPQRLKELAPDEGERQVTSREATVAASSRLRTLMSENPAPEHRSRALRLAFAEVEMRCIQAIPTASAFWRSLPR